MTAAANATSAAERPRRRTLPALFPRAAKSRRTRQPAHDQTFGVLRSPRHARPPGRTELKATNNRTVKITTHNGLLSRPVAVPIPYQRPRSLVGPTSAEVDHHLPPPIMPGAPYQDGPPRSTDELDGHDRGLTPVYSRYDTPVVLSGYTERRDLAEDACGAVAAAFAAHCPVIAAATVSGDRWVRMDSPTSWARPRNCPRPARSQIPLPPWQHALPISPGAPRRPSLPGQTRSRAASVDGSPAENRRHPQRQGPARRGASGCASDDRPARRQLIAHARPRRCPTAR